VARLFLTLALLVTLAAPIAARDPFVNILLTTSPSVSVTARVGMIREITRIWSRAGVRFEWPDPSSDPTGLTLRVMTIERTGPSDEPALLGELIRGAGTRAVAMIALDRAIAIASREIGDRGPLLYDERLGLVLGRVAAHEIGHFLLASEPHHDSGLMRERFPETELAATWSKGFELPPASREVVRNNVLKSGAVRVPSAIAAATAGK
jgi:hypothetical protein